MQFEEIQSICKRFDDIVSEDEISGEQIEELAELTNNLIPLVSSLNVFPYQQNKEFPIDLFRFMTLCDSDEIFNNCLTLMISIIQRDIKSCNDLVNECIHGFLFEKCIAGISESTKLIVEALSILCRNNSIAQNRISHSTIFDFLIENSELESFPHEQVLSLIDSCCPGFSYDQCLYIFPYLNRTFKTNELEVPTIQVMSNIAMNCPVLITTFSRFNIISSLTSYLLADRIESKEIALASLKFLSAVYQKSGNAPVHEFFKNKKLYSNLGEIFSSSEQQNEILKCLIDICSNDKEIINILHDSPLQEVIVQSLSEPSKWDSEKKAVVLLLTEFFTFYEEYKDIVMDPNLLDSIIAIIESSDAQEKLFILENLYSTILKGFVPTDTIFDSSEFIEAIEEQSTCGISQIEVVANSLLTFYKAEEE